MHTANQYIKLGTALRYLIDARAGTPIAGKYVLENLRVVLNLITELGFEATSQSGGVKVLRGLESQLEQLSASPNNTLSEEHAEQLEVAGRKIREAILAEAALKKLQPIDSTAASQPENFADLSTSAFLKLLGNVKPMVWLSVALSIFTVLSAVFGAGMVAENLRASFNKDRAEQSSQPQASDSAKATDTLPKPAAKEPAESAPKFPDASAPQ